jgi:uncharacterized RDD family membrane protein YckC
MSEEQPKIKAEDVTELELASHGQRIGNYLIDQGCYLILFTIISFFLDSMNILKKLDETTFLIIYCILVLVYCVSFEFLTGQTPGKVITKTRVVTDEGEKPTFGAILIRTLCRFIPLEAISFLGPNAIGFHDIFSKTRVVIDNKQV